MNRTLRDKIEHILQNAIARKEFLNGSLRDYVESGNYSDAAKIDIKIAQLGLFIQELEEALK